MKTVGKERLKKYNPNPYADRRRKKNYNGGMNNAISKL